MKLENFLITPLTILFLIHSVTAYSSYYSDIPFFIKFYVLVLGLHHASMIAFLWEIKGVSKSKVWDNIFNANICGIFITFSLALLLYNLYLNSINWRHLLVICAGLDIVAHIFADITLYYLVKPIIKEKLNLFKYRYLALYAGITGSLFFLIIYNLKIKFPTVSTDLPFSILGLLFAFTVFYFVYSPIIISEAYREIGFVRKPFSLAGIGALTFVISSILVLYVTFYHIETTIRHQLFYNIAIYVLASIFSLIFYTKFIVEYPSLLERKWKALMPFDFIKIATTLALFFLAVSLYFSAEKYLELPFRLEILLPVLLGLLAIFITVIYILSYTNSIYNKSKLVYWIYLKAGLFIHVASTLYVLALIILLWKTLNNIGKYLSSFFIVLVFSFYISYAMDLRTILKNLGIRTRLTKAEITGNAVLLYAIFLIIFFFILLTYGKTSLILYDIQIESYPFLLFSIAVFLVAYISYLSVTHKGFEEMMKKNIWSELTYISGFLTFITVYLLYTSEKNVQLFLFHDFFFISYFVMLLIEIASIRTLGYHPIHKKGEKSLMYLFYHHTSAYFRVDYLEKKWKKIVDTYKHLDSKLSTIKYNPAKRSFDLSELNEKARTVVAVAMLLEMYQDRKDLGKVTPLGERDIKREIKETLKEKVLLLPADLRSKFDEDEYYPLLYEYAINTIIEKIKPFVPVEEHQEIFNKLKRVDDFFESLELRDSKINFKTEKRISRRNFIRYLKMYLRSIEERFPFEDKLLYESVKELVNRDLSNYGFSVVDLLDIVPSGINPVDRISGGLKKGTMTLLISEENKYKNEFLESFIRQGLKDGDCNIYATSKLPSQEIYNNLLMDFEIKKTTLIDLYQSIYTTSPVSSIREEPHKIIIPPTIISWKISLTKAVKKYSKEEHKRIVIDVFNDLLRYYNQDEITKVLYRQLEGLRKWNCTVIIVLYPKTFQENKYEEIKKWFDNVLILVGREKTYLNFDKLHGGLPKKRSIPLEEQW